MIKAPRISRVVRNMFIAKHIDLSATDSTTYVFANERDAKVRNIAVAYVTETSETAGTVKVGTDSDDDRYATFTSETDSDPGTVKSYRAGDIALADDDLPAGAALVISHAQSAAADGEVVVMCELEIIRDTIEEFEVHPEL